jgi:hypothetical protein
VPLACGRPDAVDNTRWQTIAKAKDRWERKVREAPQAMPRQRDGRRRV